MFETTFLKYLKKHLQAVGRFNGTWRPKYTYYCL